MKSLNRMMWMAAVAAAVVGGSVSTQAQGRDRGNFDPEQFRQRMEERMRERMGVTDDAEWKLISERVTKVMEARRAAGPSGMGMFGGGPGGPGGRGPGGGGGRGPGGGGSSPEEEALSKAVEGNASADELKKKMEAVRTARKAAEAQVEKAQAELREVLTVKQEANAVLMGLLK